MAIRVVDRTQLDRALDTFDGRQTPFGFLVSFTSHWANMQEYGDETIAALREIATRLEEQKALDDDATIDSGRTDGPH